ncbi:MAG: alanine racemase [Capsulimonadaceae bacterium]|nr:alanine racemase [Capsulimonadaceae bacterium]
MSDGLFATSEPNAWVDVDCAALQANATLLRRQFSRPEIIAVVKADGYGHGAVQSALAFRRAGVGRFAVTSLDEASTLTAGGIAATETPILVFAPVVTSAQAAELCRIGAQATVCDAHHVRLLIQAAEGAGTKIGVHVKVDTGMSRLGEMPSDALGIVRLVAASDRLTIAGVYTHFARASEKDLAPTRAQCAKFKAFIEQLSDQGIKPGLCHAANSAAAMRLPEAHFDAVRLGTILYGQYPSVHVPRIDGLNGRTWSAKARVVFVRRLQAGALVGYGSEARISRPSRVAVIAVGYADGFGMSPDSLHRGKRGVAALARQLAGRENQHVLIHGHRAPVLGRVAMQMIVVDVTGIPIAVEDGDIAEIPMRRLAASPRLPRVYHGKP